MKKWLKRIGIGILVIFGLAAGAYMFVNESLPKGQSGPFTDSLAIKMMEAINDEAWKKTGAISWDFGGRRQLLWDRKRHFTEVTWDENVVQVNLNTQKGIIKKKKFDNTKTDDELVKEAWEIWVNDSFWLNPVSKVFDPGTTRQMVKSDPGTYGLLITYDSGGATPGDSYLWIVDNNYRPIAWKLWVSIVPFGGFRFSWDEWKTLSTGVQVSTFHHSTLFDLRLSDIKAATTLEGLVGTEDPFAELKAAHPEEKDVTGDLPEEKMETPEEEETEETNEEKILEN